MASPKPKDPVPPRPLAASRTFTPGWLVYVVAVVLFLVVFSSQFGYVMMAPRRRSLYRLLLGRDEDAALQHVQQLWESKGRGFNWNQVKERLDVPDYLVPEDVQPMEVSNIGYFAMAVLGNKPRVVEYMLDVMQVSLVERPVFGAHRNNETRVPGVSAPLPQLRRPAEDEADIFRDLRRCQAWVRPHRALSLRFATPLHLATVANHTEMVTLMLERGANVNVRTLEYFDPLLLATNLELEHMMRVLLGRGAIARGEYRTFSGLQYRMQPIHVAASIGFHAGVSLLLQYGEDPNVRSFEGEGDAPLHGAAGSGNLALVQLLLEAGADPQYKSNDGRSAIDLAYLRGNHHIVRYLIDEHDIRVSTYVNRMTPTEQRRGAIYGKPPPASTGDPGMPVSLMNELEDMREKAEKEAEERRKEEMYRKEVEQYRELYAKAKEMSRGEAAVQDSQPRQRKKKRKRRRKAVKEEL